MSAILANASVAKVAAAGRAALGIELLESAAQREDAVSGRREAPLPVLLEALPLSVQVEHEAIGVVARLLERRLPRGSCVGRVGRVERGGLDRPVQGVVWARARAGVVKPPSVNRPPDQS